MTTPTAIEREREQRRALAAAHPFGAWLLRQGSRPCYIGRLARYAARDRRFPRHGSPREVAARIAGQAWDEDTIAALQDAACEWRGLILRALTADTDQDARYIHVPIRDNGQGALDLDRRPGVDWDQSGR